jgi:uncharacterized protein
MLRTTIRKERNVTDTEEMLTATKESRKALFSKLGHPVTQPEFWSRVADDVDWTVKGTHPLAGRYQIKTEFVESTFGRLAGVLSGGVKLEITNLYIEGDTAIAELRSTSTTNELAESANDYCWVCRFEGDVIAEVRAYLDSTMVAYTILRNESARTGEECVQPA